MPTEVTLRNLQLKKKKKNGTLSKKALNWNSTVIIQETFLWIWFKNMFFKLLSVILNFAVLESGLTKKIRFSYISRTHIPLLVWTYASSKAAILNEDCLDLDRLSLTEHSTPGSWCGHLPRSTLWKRYELHRNEHLLMTAFAVAVTPTSTGRLRLLEGTDV